jgi:hypothetical protein
LDKAFASRSEHTKRNRRFAAALSATEKSAEFISDDLS